VRFRALLSERHPLEIKKQSFSGFTIQVLPEENKKLVSPLFKIVNAPSTQRKAAV
jgi:hypothetical protein